MAQQDLWIEFQSPWPAEGATDGVHRNLLEAGTRSDNWGKYPSREEGCKVYVARRAIS